MADQFLGEIRAVGFNFPPYGWALCQGQVLSIQQNTALFSLLGTTYGGDGRSTFQLPNLTGNVAISSGQGPGLSERILGDNIGEPFVTLSQFELPIHSHETYRSNSPAATHFPQSSVQAVSARNVYASSANANLDAATILSSGGGIPHNNMMPYLAINYIIALTGIFPSRS